MTNVLSTFLASFTPLRIRNFRIYLGGQAVSLIGTWLQATAQGWVVWELTGSTAALGITSMLSTLPILLVGPWAGSWADRYDRRKLLIGTQVVAMFLAFILAFLTQTNTVQLWHVYILAFTLGIVTAIDMPAQQAFLGDLSGMSEVRKAVNLNIMFLQVSRVVGPGIAGFIIGALGTATAFWLNGLSFLAVIFSLLAVRAAQVRITHSTNPLRQFAESVQFVRGQPRMMELIALVIFMTFFGLAIILSLLPAVASDVLGGDATTLGVLMSSAGAGALVGTLFLVPMAQAQRRPGVVMAGAAMWVGTWFIMLGFSTQITLSAITLFFGSFGPPIVITTALGLIQVMSPPDMRARLMSLFFMVSFGMQPIAALLVGLSAEFLGTPMAIRINGFLLVVSTLTLFATRPELRVWEVKAKHSAPEPQLTESDGAMLQQPIGVTE